MTASTRQLSSSDSRRPGRWKIDAVCPATARAWLIGWQWPDGDTCPADTLP